MNRPHIYALVGAFFAVMLAGITLLQGWVDRAFDAQTLTGVPIGGSRLAIFVHDPGDDGIDDDIQDALRAFAGLTGALQSNAASALTLLTETAANPASAPLEGPLSRARGHTEVIGQSALALQEVGLILPELYNKRAAQAATAKPRPWLDIAFWVSVLGMIATIAGLFFGWRKDRRETEELRVLVEKHESNIHN